MSLSLAKCLQASEKRIIFHRILAHLTTYTCTFQHFFVHGRASPFTDLLRDPIILILHREKAQPNTQSSVKSELWLLISTVCICPLSWAWFQV